MEGLRRKLRRWLCFGCGGFEIYGGELADSAGEWEALKRRPWRRERGEVNRGRERERERAREWAREGEGEVRAFNAAYGMAGDRLDGRHVAATDEPQSRSG